MTWNMRQRRNAFKMNTEQKKKKMYVEIKGNKCNGNNKCVHILKRQKEEKTMERRRSKETATKIKYGKKTMSGTKAYTQEHRQMYQPALSHTQNSKKQI